MNEDFRYLTAEEFLASKGIDRNLEPPPGLSNVDKLYVMVDTGIPIEIDTVANLLNNALYAGDFDSIRTIHTHGKGHLLAQTTACLFYESLLDDSDTKNPAAKFEAVLSDDVLKRGRITYDDKDDLPGFLWRLVESSSINPFAPRSLRDLLSTGRIDNDVELEIETFLLERFPDVFPEDFLQKRDNWLSQQTSTENVMNDPFASDEAKRHAKSNSIIELCKQGDEYSLQRAVNLLDFMDASEHASLLWILTPALLSKGRVDLTRKIENDLRIKLTQLPERPFNNYPYYELADSQIESADEEGIINSLKEANGKGLMQLCSDMGVVPDELSVLFIWSNLENRNSSISTASSLFYLLLGEYKTKAKGFPSDRFYRELLKRRILAFGEEGIGFPTEDRLGEDSDFVLEMGITFALRRNVEEVKRWIKRLNVHPNAKSYSRNIISKL